MRVWKPVLFLGCLAFATVAMALPASQEIPRITLSQPSCLSTSAETTVGFEALAHEAGPAVLEVTLATQDEAISRMLLRKTIALAEGANRGSFVVTPADLAGFRLHEDATLTARLTTSAGSVLEDDVDATVLPEEVVPEGGTWICVLTTKPALIYTNEHTTLRYSILNPKAEITKINLHLKFMNDKKKKKVTQKVTLHVPPGLTEQDVLVPSSVTTAARAKGDTLLKTTLKVAGIVKKKDLALLDYDFKCSASADPVGGNAPLNVFFTGNATGGVPPYNFAWEFGDGGTSSGQNTAHVYTAAGTFTTLLTVTDSLGGLVSAPTTPITVAQPPLTLSCTVSPLLGVAPLVVNFTATASGGSGVYTWDWNFGDNSAHSSAQNPSHTYTTAAQYAGVVTVTDGTYTKSCTTSTITVSWPEFNVSCNVSPTVGKAPLTVSFTCTPSGGSGSFTYDWDFGDGSGHSSSQNPGHTYTVAGTYYPKVTVNDASQSKQCSPPYIVVTTQ